MKTWNRFFPASLAYVLVLLFAGSAFAQGRVNKYTVTAANLTWTDISSTGTPLTTGTFGYWHGTLTMTMPFAFNYDNNTIASGSSLYLSSGSLGFGSSISYGYTYGGLQASAEANRIFAFGGAYVAMGSRVYGSGIYYQTTGAAGNQVFTVQINGVHSPGADYTSGATAVPVQIKLYQATGVIQFLYKSHGATVNPYGYSSGIGLNGATSPSFQYLTYSTGNNTTPATDLTFTPPPPPAELSLQPKILNFGSVGTGFTLTLNDTVRSTGAANLVINSATITGSGDYTIASGPVNGTILTPGTKAVYGIQFAPSANGSRSATFTVSTTGADSGTQSCLLNGTGLAPNVVYSFPYNGNYPNNTLFHHVARHFGATATQYFYVQNTGQVAMFFNSIYFIGLQSSMYSLVHVPPNPMPANSLDSIGVQFSPYLEGRPDAQLVISTNTFNIPYDTVAMWGVGILAHLVVTPSQGMGNTLMFDSVAIGDSVCQSLTLHNTGSDTLYITKQIVTYGDYDFHFYLLNGADTMLVPDASKIVNVCFVPVARGDRFASVRFNTNIPKTYPDNRDTSQFPISVTGTGVPYGILSMANPAPIAALLDSTVCMPASIKNVGLSDLTVTTATISGAGSSDFTLSPPAPYTIPAGKSQAVTICYTASTRGPEAVSLALNGMTSGRPVVQTVALNGIGLQACLDAAPSPISFGSMALPGKTLAKSGHDTTCITVTNCGDTTQTFSAAFTPGTNANYHLLGSVVTPPVLPNGTTTICVEFDADTIGPANGSVVVSANVKAAMPKTLTLAGIGGGVVISGTGDGGTVSMAKCDTITVTINNTGNVPWTPGMGITTTGANASDFMPIGTTNPATIPAGGSGTLKVAFCPTTSGLSETANLTFPSSSPAVFGGMATVTGLGALGAGVAQRTEQDGFSLGASYPNPNNGKADVIVTMPHESKVTIALTNLSGAVVRTVFDGTLQTGDNTITLDAKDLPSGTYFYMLTSGTVQLTREMIIVR